VLSRSNLLSIPAHSRLPFQRKYYKFDINYKKRTALSDSGTGYEATLQRHVPISARSNLLFIRSGMHLHFIALLRFCQDGRNIICCFQKFANRICNSLFNYLIPTRGMEKGQALAHIGVCRKGATPIAANL
jgi:hypothetical protein